MLKSLLVTLALGLAARPDVQASSSLPTLSQVRNQQVEVMQYMATALTEGHSVPVNWDDCGMENGFYFPWPAPSITLCNESIRGDWRHAVFEAAHEMGHAIVEDRGLPLDADTKAPERAADELGALALIEMGKPEIVQAAALYYQRQALEFVPDSDPHPDYETRAWELMCLQAGSEDGTPECKMLYHLVRTRWALAFLLTDTSAE